MAKILIGITGSVAAVRAPMLFRQLTEAGHDVKAIATRAALYFFESGEFGRYLNNPFDFAHDRLVVDEDEWPGTGYRRDDPVLHIELRRWADLLVIAPLDANTLAKLACGLADNCLTCVWRAWDRSRPVALAPAMNTLMWEHPLTLRHLHQLGQDFGVGASARRDSGDTQEIVDEINATCSRLRIVGPQSKRLACGDVGMGALAEPAEIVATVGEMLGRSRQ